MRHFSRSFAVALLVASAASDCLAIARWMRGDQPNRLVTDAPLPADMLSSFVRTRKNSFYPRVGGREFDSYGSGVVVKTQIDREADKGWVWILTADHVVAPRKSINGQEPQTSIYIGFGNGDAENNKPSYAAEKIFRGPVVEGKRVDMAIIRYYTDNLLRLPQNLKSVPIFQWSGNTRADVTMVGSGDYAKSASAEEWFYNVSSKDPGVLRRGLNKINGAVVHDDDDDETGGIYKYQALQSKLDFQFGDDGKAFSGDAYFLGSDSGGATLEKQGDNWGVIGIHAVSEKSQRDPLVMKDGYKQWDVAVGDRAYAEWLRDSLKPVPEPSTVAGLAAGLMLFAKHRRKTASR
jgi:hypothetical protein